MACRHVQNKRLKKSRFHIWNSKRAPRSWRGLSLDRRIANKSHSIRLGMDCRMRSLAPLYQSYTYCIKPTKFSPAWDSHLLGRVWYHGIGRNDLERPLVGESWFTIAYIPPKSWKAVGPIDIFSSSMPNIVHKNKLSLFDRHLGLGFLWPLLKMSWKNQPNKSHGIQSTWQ